jgi:hypothetical protein
LELQTPVDKIFGDEFPVVHALDHADTKNGCGKMKDKCADP